MPTFEPKISLPGPGYTPQGFDYLLTQSSPLPLSSYTYLPGLSSYSSTITQYTGGAPKILERQLLNATPGSRLSLLCPSRTKVSFLQLEAAFITCSRYRPASERFRCQAISLFCRYLRIVRYKDHLSDLVPTLWTTTATKQTAISALHPLTK